MGLKEKWAGSTLYDKISHIYIYVTYKYKICVCVDLSREIRCQAEVVALG